LTTQKQRKRKLDKEWVKIRDWVYYERDKGRCVIHPQRMAVAVHHIAGKGANPALRCRKENLISLCALCHDENANTKPFIKKCLKAMSKFGYELSQIDEFKGYLGENDENNSKS
jgi:hypothetical protein